MVNDYDSVAELYDLHNPTLRRRQVDDTLRIRKLYGGYDRSAFDAQASPYQVWDLERPTVEKGK